MQDRPANGSVLDLRLNKHIEDLDEAQWVIVMHATKQLANIMQTVHYAGYL